MIYLFIGMPGSGKDTQAELLEEKYGFTVISTGMLFREEMEAQTELGNRIAEKMDGGELIDDQSVMDVLKAKLQRLETENIILTGAVRRHAQIDMLDATLAEVGTKLEGVVVFELAEDAAIERISGRRMTPDGQSYHVVYNPPPEGVELIQREDDKPENVKVRFQEFHKHNQPIIDEYDQRGLLIRVDATPLIDEVHQSVVERLGLDS